MTHLDSTRFHFIGRMLSTLAIGWASLSTIACGHTVPGAAVASTSTDGGAALATPRVCAGRHVSTNQGLRALASCTEVQGDLVISGHAVTSLRPLSRLSAVHGHLAISHTSLPTLSGLENLERIQRLTLDGNHRLISVRQLSRIESAASVELRDNPLLYGGASEFFPRLVRAGEIVIEHNAAISGAELAALLRRVSIEAPSAEQRVAGR